MRLLRSTTLQIEEFVENEVPPYAILSHTWGENEVLFKDIQSLTDAQRKAGYKKVANCCRQAALDGIDWVWIDTCCIDKGSSAELSEAINSMFRWYRQAKVCYAYLSDVHEDNANIEQKDGSFARSRWFTRGWTLQELIAPISLIFFNSSWIVIGRKCDLSQALSEITNIDYQSLCGQPVSQVSVANRMSWASKRVTTRTEDMAYCLMGLFDVHMPLIYGEGNGAFRRLQEEIMKDSEDQSLFSWTTFDESEQTTGLLAESPANFVGSRNVVPFQIPFREAPYAMTNRGIRIDMPLMPDPELPGNYLAFLGCRDESNAEFVHGIEVQNLSMIVDKFVRISPSVVRRMPLQCLEKAAMKTIYVKKDVLDPMGYNLENSFKVRSLPCGYELSEVFPIDRWYQDQNIIRNHKINNAPFGMLLKGSPNVVVIVGTTLQNVPWCNVLRIGDDETLEMVILSSRSKFLNGYRKSLGQKSMDVKFHKEISSRGVVFTALDIIAE
jgi:Heterokaryon incompatibility protein (HET)